jgi:hypothetical protein
MAKYDELVGNFEFTNFYRRRLREVIPLLTLTGYLRPEIAVALAPK